MLAKLEKKSFAFTEFKILDASQGLFEGYLAVFGNVDYDGDIFDPEAFTASLANWAARGELPPIRWNHDENEPVGDYISIVADKRGLKVRGKLWMDDRAAPTEATVKAWRVTTSTGPKGLSVGFITKNAVRKDGARLITQADLMEGSVVQYPANSQSVITGAKSMKFTDDAGDVQSIRDMEKSMRDAGLSAKQAKALLAGGYKALTRDDELHAIDEEELQRAEDSATRLKEKLARLGLNKKVVDEVVEEVEETEEGEEEDYELMNRRIKREEEEERSEEEDPKALDDETLPEDEEADPMTDETSDDETEDEEIPPLFGKPKK